jgi:tRNA (guanine-N7-)-methyltransferase
MTAHKPGDPTTLNRLYGRSKGKTLRTGQQGLIETLLPQIAVPGEGPVTAERLFGRDCALHFEIGFGGGAIDAGDCRSIAMRNALPQKRRAILDAG